MDQQNPDFEFTPHTLEEHISQLRYMPKEHSPDVRLVHTLHEIYTADERIIQRTRARLVERLQTSSENESEHVQSGQLMQQPPLVPKKQGTRSRHFLLIAAILITMLVIGSSIGAMKIFQLQSASFPLRDPGASSTAHAPVAPSSLYLVKGDGAYLLDAHDSSVKWRYPHEAGQGELTGATISQSDQTLFLTRMLTTGETSQFFLDAIDLQGGKLRWQKELQVHKMVIAGGTLYASTIQPGTNGEVLGVLYALNAATGDVRWTTKETRLLPGTVHDGKLFVTLDPGLSTDIPSSLLALDVSNGEMLWSTSLPTEERFVTSPQVVENVLFIASCTRPIYYETHQCSYQAYQPGNGKSVWRATLPTSGLITGEGTIVNGLIYIGLNDRQTMETRLYALQAFAEGKVRWSRLIEKGGTLLGAPVVANNTIYVGTALPNVGNGHAVALNATDGKILWSVEARDATVPTTVVTQDPLSGAYYSNQGAGSSKSKIQVRRLDDGSLAREYLGGDSSGPIFLVALI